jgi:hypothetical protein
MRDKSGLVWFGFYLVLLAVGLLCAPPHQDRCLPPYAE